MFIAVPKPNSDARLLDPLIGMVSEASMHAPRQKYSVLRNLQQGRLRLSGSNFATHVAAIFLLSATVQLLAGWLLLFRHEVPSLDMDEQEYWGLASQIMSGVSIEVGRRTLAFPLLIAALRKISDDVLFVQSAASVLAASAAPLLALVVRKMSGSRSAALLAGTAFALWPTQVFYGSSLYSETLALPVFLLFLLVLPFRGEASGSRWWTWLIAGAVLGMATQVRPMYELFLPVLALVLLLDLRHITKAIIRFALVAAGFAVVILPWSAYVTEKLGHPILVTANGGETFAGGFNPELLRSGVRFMQVGNRTTWYGPGKWLPVAQNGYLSLKEQSLPYAEQDKLMRSRAMKWVESNPREALYLTWRKFAYMWGIYPFALNGWAQAMFGNTLTLALLALFIVALTQDREVRRRCARLYLLPLFVTGVALISWGSWRFRLPADAGMVGIVAIWLSAKTAMLTTSNPLALRSELA